MNCDICGKNEARLRRLTRSYGRGDDLMVIENVPVISCPSCGESYLTAKTLHEVDRIRRESAQRAPRRLVPVASFG